MAFREVAIGNMADLPSVIQSFLGSLGWQAAPGSFRRPPEADEVANPSGPQPIVFDMVASDAPTGNAATDPTNANGVTNDRQLTIRSQANAALAMRVRAPWLHSGVRQPAIPNPTKVYCFGEGLPAAWASFVVEFGFNQYRCFHVGRLDRSGAWGSGDIFSCSNGIHDQDDQGWPKDYRDWHGMFSGGQDAELVSGGGVFMRDYPDAAGPAATGLLPLSSGSNQVLMTVAGWNPGFVFGGPKDGPMETMLSHGFSPFTGESFLAPIPLFTTYGASNNRRVRPLGTVRGTRGVNMRNLEPGQRIVVGNKAWRVFPQLAKNLDPATVMGPRGAAQTGTRYSPYTLRESSWTYGFAYLEGDA